jgi:predicted metal-dependent phosphoesterase TrpH
VPYIIRLRSARQDADLAEHRLQADPQGELSITCSYEIRGEHFLDLFPEPAAQRLARLHFYVAPAELYARRPLRGDFHIHTLYSDGRSTPVEMLIRARELGLDVAVITDHNSYEASIEGIEAQENLGLNLITMPGEEVSGPNWHILSIGADAAIYDLSTAAFTDQDIDPGSYEALRWAIEATQAHGGRAYLAHPYWAVERGYHLPLPIYERVLSEGILDGLELLGDVRYENNVRSLARYLDFRAAGGTIPILSNSDTHRTDHTYGTYWTLILAHELSAEGVLDAIAEGWSVACTTVKPLPLHQRAAAMEAYGPFELVDYAYFLEQHFYPQHDQLCEQEAALAYRAWRGEQLARHAMREHGIDMEALYMRCGVGPR